MTADAELVTRCRAGDPQAMRELIQQFQGDVFGLCMRMLRHAQDSEDVAQETFVRVFRSLHRWDAGRPLRPWVLAIAVNRCRTAMGKRARRPESADYLNELPGREVPADDAPEVTAAIRSAVDQLRDDFREVFLLFHERGQSYEEISVEVGRPVGTIKTWLHRARAQVLERLRSLGLVHDEDARVELP